MIELRKYQQEAIDIICNMEEGERKLIHIATGGGKTQIMANVIATTTNRCLVIVPSEELRKQTEDKIRMWDNEADIGHVQAGLNQLDTRIVIAMRQSLASKKSTRLEKMLDNGEFEYVFIDEVHIASNTLHRIVSKLNSNIKVVGLTATPYNVDITKIFNKASVQKPIFELIMENYLCEPKALVVESKTDLSNIKTINGDFAQGELEQAVNNTYRNDLIVQAYKKYASDRKHTLLFCSGIEHSISLAEEFNKNGLYAKSLSSDNNIDRENILSEFSSGKLPILCNVSMLTTGLDIPQISCIMLCRPTRSRILFEQIIGRGLRLYDDKENCLIIDIQDKVINNHNLMDLSSVFDLDIKSGETLKEAYKREEDEKIANALKKEQEKLQREKIERKRQEELELIAKQIQLFNRDISNVFSERRYDWFKIDNLTYAISLSSDNHIVIEQNMDNEFSAYKVSTGKGIYDVELCENMDTLLYLVDYVEDELLINQTSFVNKTIKWKFDKMTDKQKLYCKFGQTKWDAHKYFTSNAIKSRIKNYKINNII